MDYYDNQTYYDILGINPNSTIDNIEKAKNRLKFGGPDDRAPFRLWGKIDEAYNVLSDPIKRAEYDKTLKEQTKEISRLERVEETIIDNSYKSVAHSLSNGNSSLFQNEFIPRLKTIGKEVVLALPTSIIATISIIKKLDRKFSLDKNQPGEQITQVKTEESELIEEYRRKLDEKIEDVLTQYYHNYDLMIDKIRYENYIELLKKRIELKENQVVKKGGLLKYKLQLTALRNQLKTFEVSLEKVNNRIKSNIKVQKLSKIYDSLYQVSEKIEQINQSPIKKIVALKKLQIRKENLMNKGILKIERIKSNREYYAIFKDSFLVAHSNTKNFIENLFVPIDNIDQKTI